MLKHVAPACPASIRFSGYWLSDIEMCSLGMAVKHNNELEMERMLCRALRCCLNSLLYLAAIITAIPHAPKLLKSPWTSEVLIRRCYGEAVAGGRVGVAIGLIGPGVGVQVSEGTNWRDGTSK